MPDITTSSEDDIKKFLQGKINESGFSLENEATKILKKYFDVNRDVPFFDKDENKGRAFDISARKFFPDDSHFDKEVLRSIAQYDLVIECKNIPGNIWAFFLDEDPSFTLPLYASMNEKGKDPAITVIPTEPIKNIPYVSAFDEYIFDNAKTNKQTNNLYSALMTVTKAARHKKDYLRRSFKALINSGWTPKAQKYILHFTFFQPVIIFSGKIFIIKYDASGNPEFESVKFVQKARGYVSKDYDESGGEIHIVTFDALEEYISLVDAYYRLNENLIVKNQTRLFTALQQVLPNLEI